jgi:hypothetical protein
VQCPVQVGQRVVHLRVVGVNAQRPGRGEDIPSLVRPHRPA